MTAIPASLAAAGPCSTVGVPLTSSSPLSGWYPPARIFPSVDLPAPFSPTSPCTSPPYRSIEASTIACTAPNALAEFRSDSSGGPVVAVGPWSAPGVGPLAASWPPAGADPWLSAGARSAAGPDGAGVGFGRAEPRPSSRPSALRPGSTDSPPPFPRFAADLLVRWSAAGLQIPRLSFSGPLARVAQRPLPARPATCDPPSGDSLSARPATCRSAARPTGTWRSASPATRYPLARRLTGRLVL